MIIRPVSPFGIVEHLNIIEDVGPGIVSSFVDLTFYPFSFKLCKETFSHSIVMAVTFATHANLQVVGF